MLGWGACGGEGLGGWSQEVDPSCLLFLTDMQLRRHKTHPFKVTNSVVSIFKMCHRNVNVMCQQFQFVKGLRKRGQLRIVPEAFKTYLLS